MSSTFQERKKKVNIDRIIHFAGAVAAVATLAGCASPASTGTNATGAQAQGQLIQKKVAYVMSAGDSGRQVYAPGTSGDVASRQLEQSGLDALRAVYTDVVVVPSAKDTAGIQAAGISYVFTPQIKADFSAPSPFAKPLTVFNTEVVCIVTNPAGSELTRVKANGAGKAEFDEFRYDPGLAARRASSDLSAKLSDEIRKNTLLR
jgi:hypothetical protein